MDKTLQQKLDELSIELRNLCARIGTLQRDNNALLDAVQHLARMHRLDFVSKYRGFYDYPVYCLEPLVEDPPPAIKAISHPKEDSCK